MTKHTHEIRDPIHTFVRLETAERRVVDSLAFQRLCNIHQLAMTFLVYPGATHNRFEHSLGVMELAGRVFDIVTDANNLHEKVRNIVQLPSAERLYWRRAVRMAALCHDLGHLPFSHAAEKELLPEGWDHERITCDIIRSAEMEDVWNSITPPLRSADIVKLAVGPKKLKDVIFDDWETILSEIIVGDAFGVDRMDYLLRDSYHMGVAYGNFDRYRLIDTLRILPREDRDSEEPALGLEEGGLHSAEALMLARYFMYQQVYFHPVRRIYDIHLKDFLKAWLDGGYFSTDVDRHLEMTDVEVISAMRKAHREEDLPGHDAASHIIGRNHFRLLYERNPNDQKINIESSLLIRDAVVAKFGTENVRYDSYRQKGSSSDFPVQTRDGRIISSLNKSKTLSEIPVVAVDYVFVNKTIYKETSAWLREKRKEIIVDQPELELGSSEKN